MNITKVMNDTRLSDVSNLTNHTDQDISSSTISKVIYLGIVPVLAVFGILLNVVCLAMFCKLNTKSSTVIYLTGLAAADILILINGLIFTLMAASAHYEIPFSRDQQTKMMTYLAPYVMIIPGKIGNILTLLISLEKLLSMIIPFRIRRYSTKRRAGIAVILSFIFPLVLCIPNLFFFSADTTYTNTSNSITFSVALRNTGFKYQDKLYILQEGLLRFVPVFGVTVSSICTCAIVISSARNRRTLSASQKRHSEEAQVTKTLLTITFVFVLCNLPLAILKSLVIAGIGTTNATDVASVFLHVCLIVNSVVNCFIYYTTSSRYKAQLKKMFQCCFNVPRNRIPSSVGVYTVSTSTENELKQI